MGRLLIGIDPDTEKNGVAYVNGVNISLRNMTFFELFDLLKYAKENFDDILVVVEGGWLNKSNWHKSEKGSAALNAKIGSHTGANHETGKKIVEMIEYLEIKYKVVKPTKSKIKADSFKKITKIQEQTNQEKRDAYMLVYGLK